MDLPVFEMVINNEETSDVEVAAVAFVDKPAIEKNFLAFKDQRVQFAVNPDKRIVSGPAMVADQLIYRKDENGEYNVFFSAETIRDIAIKFFKKDYQKNINLFHDPNMSQEGVTIFESFVSDASRGIQPMKGFEDLPDGSWFISAKVENEDVWNRIKSGEVKGFSVEGIFSFLKRGENRPVLNSTHFNEETSIMNDLKNLWNQFKEKFLGELPVATPPVPNTAPDKLGNDSTLKDGTVVTIDRLEVGGVVMIGDAPAPAGVHELSDGTKVTVGEGGVITLVEGGQMAPVEDYSKQFAAYEERLSGYEQKFTEHINAYNALAGEFSKAKEQMSQLVQLVGQIIETPTAETVTSNQSGFNSHTPSKDEKQKNLINFFANIKKK